MPWELRPMDVRFRAAERKEFSGLFKDGLGKLTRVNAIPPFGPEFCIAEIESHMITKRNQEQSRWDQDGLSQVGGNPNQSILVSGT
ncbi:hypothetical protein FRC10_008707 [Ceratobasidium sp. 414]|nr:hypothetical protein FRC10_008707 [Ceratobasidium sp. 414]